jgi:hypothetical protein
MRKHVYLSIIAVCTGAAVAPGAAYASKTGISVESVNPYSACFGAGSDLSNSDSSANNFLSGLVYTGSPFVQSNYWQDANAWNVDFLDPATANAPSGADDSSTTDAPNIGISFFQGHGINPINGSANTFCFAQSACSSPPSGSSNGWGGGPLSNAGTCSYSPLTSDLYYQATKITQHAGVCDWASFRTLVTCGSGDSGNSSNQNHFAVYTGPNVVLGNNPTAGGWRGAGTNGGASMAIFHVSHGMEPWFPNLEWSSLYGGIQIFGGIMVTPGGDTNDSPGFGGAVAAPFKANPNSSAGFAYTNAISSIGDGGGCEEGGTPYAGASYGGGINGCGCNAAVSYSNSSSHAQTLMNTTWTGLQSNSSLASSTAYYYYSIGCNYNPSSFGWQGGN